MQLTVEQPTLSAALATAASVIERKSTIPALANVLLTAEDGKLTIRATDLDLSIDTQVAAEVTTPGALTVQADLLANVVKRMPKGGHVNLTEKDGRLHVSSGRSKFDFATLPVDQYPEIASDEYGSEFAIAADELSRLIGKAAFAMSTEETKWFLNGIYLHPTAEGITAVATDGHRLAKVWSDANDDFHGVIIPRKTVGELRKVLATAIGDVQVSVSETKIRFDLGDTVIVSKVVDGTFPDYARIIPQGYPNTARVDAKAFSSAASLVAMVSEDKVRAVTINVGKDSLHLEVAGGNHKAEDDVEAVVNGEACRVGCNSKYLSEVLAQAEGGDIDMMYKSGSDPMLFKPTEDEQFLAVVMPMRVT